MSRKEQIDRIEQEITEAMCKTNATEERYGCVPYRIAEHLVDNGVGDKDRFQAYVHKLPRTTQMVIEPIDYKEEECT